MSFTYNISTLSTSLLSQVRFNIGDTVEASHYLEDEEINFSLSQNNNNVNSTCISCCYAIIAKLASNTDFSLGPYEEKNSGNKYDRWLVLVSTFEKKSTMYSAPSINPPTTDDIFYYDLMSKNCPH